MLLWWGGEQPQKTKLGGSHGLWVPAHSGVGLRSGVHGAGAEPPRLGINILGKADTIT